jgi:hypothetical protein
MLDGGPAGWRALSAKRENKKTQLKTSSTNTDRVNEKLFSMEHGQSLITRRGEPLAIKLDKETKGLGATRSAYFIIHVEHELCGDQISMSRNQEKLNMYLYKVWT